MTRWMKVIGCFMRKRGVDDFEVIYHRKTGEGPKRVEIVRYMEPVHFYWDGAGGQNRYWELQAKASRENKRKEGELLAKTIPDDLIRKVRRLVPRSIPIVIRDDVQVGCPWDD